MSKAKILIAICGLIIICIILSFIFLFGKSKEEADTQFFTKYQMPDGKLPVFYRDEYNISVLGIEKLHPFDSKKYGKVFDRLVQAGVIQPNQVVCPQMPDRNTLLKVHTERYLESIKNSGNIARITEVLPLRFLPQSLLQSRILTPMLYATGGTMMASRTALETGWAINLGGGFHHASADDGGGFCVYSDITLAATIVKERNEKVKNIMIIDLDAHQGNGYERDFLKDDSVYILDMYNASVYPNDFVAKTAINQKIELETGIGDSEYLEILREELDRAFEKFDPDLILYNAGTDILEGDPLGGMNITDQGIIQRDEMVFRKALSTGTPIVMMLSGGYQPINAAVIAKSVENLIKTIKMGTDRGKALPNIS